MSDIIKFLKSINFILPFIGLVGLVGALCLYFLVFRKPIKPEESKKE